MCAIMWSDCWFSYSKTKNGFQYILKASNFQNSPADFMSLITIWPSLKPCPGILNISMLNSWKHSDFIKLEFTLVPPDSFCIYAQVKE